MYARLLPPTWVAAKADASTAALEAELRAADASLREAQRAAKRVQLRASSSLSSLGPGTAKGGVTMGDAAQVLAADERRAVRAQVTRSVKAGGKMQRRLLRAILLGAEAADASEAAE